jgi:aquaporin Z
MRRYLTEFLGTLFFVMTIGLAVASGSPLTPLAIGAALMVVVYMGAPVSGGHYNPAVTLALFLRNKMNRADLLPYWVAQILGAMAGAFLSRMFLDRTFTIAPAATANSGTALLIELLYTLLLALVVLNCAAREATKGNSYFGLAIGFTIVIAAFAGGGISGGAFNPAVAIGAILIDTLCADGNLGNLWIYLVGPLAGGVLAALVFKMQGEDG